MNLETLKVMGTIAYMGGIPAVLEPFAWSWAQMVEYNHFGLCGEGERIHYDRARMALHDYARNELTQRMMGDWILMLDTDIEFQPDLAARLVRTMYTHDLDVVTGLYQYKSEPHPPVVFVEHPTRKRLEILAEWDRSVDLLKVDSAGAGCLLIRRRALERIRDELRVNPFNREGTRGEDHSFFARLKELGIPAWCAWKIHAGHLMVRGVELADQTAPIVLDSFEVEAYR